MIKRKDFGFTTNDFSFEFNADDSTENNDVLFSNYKDKIEKLYNESNNLAEMFLPFLKKLRDGEGDVIKWPEEIRLKQINSFMNQIEKQQDLLTEIYGENIQE
jgi:hypothetical protein